MRGLTVRDAGLAAIVCVTTVLTLYFIAQERYFLGGPAVLAIMISLSLLRREAVPARFVLVPAIMLSALVYALVAAGLPFLGALTMGILLGGCCTVLWLLHRHIAAANRA